MSRIRVEKQPTNWENIYNIHTRKGVNIHNRGNFTEGGGATCLDALSATLLAHGSNL